LNYTWSIIVERKWKSKKIKCCCVLLDLDIDSVGGQSTVGGSAKVDGRGAEGGRHKKGFEKHDGI
jgi:hypothetical protein